jgi:hypothetical protein
MINCAHPIHRLRQPAGCRTVGEPGLGRQVVTCCGGRIAATADAFALTALLGHQHVTVCGNSLREWARDTRLPMSVA